MGRRGIFCVVGVHVQATEHPAEALVILAAEDLIAKEDDEVLGQRAVEVILLPITQGLRQVDPGNLGPEKFAACRIYDLCRRLPGGFK